MFQIELPYEVTIRAEQRVRPQSELARRPRMGTRSVPPRYVGVGPEPLVVPPGELLATRWYSSPAGYVVGVQPTMEPGYAGIVDLTELVSSKVRRATQRVALELPTVQWGLLHDLRKTQSEFSTVVSVAREFSLLLAALLQDPEKAETGESQLVQVGSNGRLSIRPEVLQSLFHSDSLAAIASKQERMLAAATGDLLQFDVISLSVGSPLLVALKPYLSSIGKIDLSTIIAAVTLWWTVIHTPPQPTPDLSRPAISCSVQDIRPGRVSELHAQSCARYRADLTAGGVAAAQRMLIALGYDVRVDGIEGSETGAARDTFCALQGVNCKSVRSPAFREAAIAAMATRFPIRKV